MTNLRQSPTSLIIFAIVALCFTMNSCSKSDQPDQKDPYCGLDSMRYLLDPTGDFLTSTFTHDDNELITKEVISKNQQILIGVEFKYNSQKKLISWAYLDQLGQKSIDFIGIYDSQDKLIAMTPKSYMVGGTSYDSVFFNYETNRFTSSIVEDGDTISKIINYYQNENRIKTEYIYNGRLDFIDSLEYTNIPFSDRLTNDALVLVTKTIPSKNHVSRVTTWDVANNKRNSDLSYTYELDSKGRVAKRTTKGNLPAPPIQPEEVHYYFYGCN